MASGLLIPHRNSPACRREQGRRCWRTLLRIWLIMRKQVKFQSPIDEVAGGPLDTCGRHRHYSTRSEINLKVIKVNWISGEGEIFSLRLFHFTTILTPSRLRSTGKGLYTCILESRAVVFTKCSSFWCRLFGGAVEAEGALYWRSSDFGRSFEGFSGMWRSFNWVGG